MYHGHIKTKYRQRPMQRHRDINQSFNVFLNLFFTQSLICLSDSGDVSVIIVYINVKLKLSSNKYFSTEVAFVKRKSWNW